MLFSLVSLMHQCAYAMMGPKSTDQWPLGVHITERLGDKRRGIAAIIDNADQSSWMAKACTNSVSSCCHDAEWDLPESIGEVATAEVTGTTSWMAPASETQSDHTF